MLLQSRRKRSVVLQNKVTKIILEGSQRGSEAAVKKTIVKVLEWESRQIETHVFSKHKRLAQAVGNKIY